MKCKRALLCLLGILIAGLLSGCGFSQSVDDLFTQPLIPAEYEALTQQLDVLLSDGYTYVSPSGGNYIQSLQMKDLDGDGVAEAMAFLQKDGEEKPLKVVVYKNADGYYHRLCNIEYNAQGIESIYYEDLTGDGKLELIVGWKVNGSEKRVTVYNIGRDCLPLAECSYTHFTAADIDQDSRPSLVVLHNDESGQPVVELYGWQSDILTLSYRGMISSSMREVSRGALLSGYCCSGTPALFITGISEDNMAMTDTLVWDDALGLRSFLPDEKTGTTAVIYPYGGQLPQDVNGDGVIEFPRFLGVGSNSAVAWMQYDAQGNTVEVEETFHCQDDGWYMSLPNTWWGRVSGDYFVDNRETQVSIKLDDVPVLSLFSIGGDGRENRALMGNRFVVKRLTDMIFSAELYDAGSDAGMDEDLLRHSFYLTEESWATQGQ